MNQCRTPSAKELFVTHVKGEGIILKFWGLATGSVEIVKNYEGIFLRNADELDRSIGFLRSDQIADVTKCAVRSKARQQWCRAVIVNIVGPSEVIVQLMDYGNIEQVSVADLRPLEDGFFRYQAQARECILADVIPATGSQWSPQAIQFCEKELLFNTMSCIVISNYLSIPVVRIAKKGESEPFVQRLINNGLAFIKQETEQNPSPSVSPKPQLTYKMNQLNPSTCHMVKVSFVESQHKFFVQLSAAELELNRLMEEIALYVSRPENALLVNSPQIGTPCLAEYKQTYYRGLITSVNQGRCVISYVDFGLTEVKEFHELLALPLRYLKLQAQAICCTLGSDVQMNSDEFLRIVSKFDNLYCHVLGHTGEAYVVQLKYNDQDIFVPRQFPQKNQMAVQALTYSQLELSTTMNYDVVIGYINDISDFYCQLVRCKDELDIISSVLNSGVEQRPISFHECLPKLPVIVKFSEDNSWYRAQIVKINHEHDIEVFFVDFGNYDNATLRDIRRMNPDLLKFPVQAYKCYLADVTVPTEASVKDEMFDYFEELTAGQAFQLRVVNVSVNLSAFSYSVVLQEKSASLSINDKIENKFSSLATIPLSDVETLFITSFTSLDSFFGQLEKLSSAKLDEMQEDINEFYANSINTTFRPKLEDKVCAKYNSDNQFYRAKVENCSGNVCNVMFIDYGNRESIPLEDIHPMDKKFLKYPQFGIECVLDKYPQGVLIDKVKSLILENSIQAKVMGERNKKKVVSLTEDYSPNAPILEILRQQEKFPARSIHGTGLRGFRDEVPRKDIEPSYSPAKSFNDRQNGYQQPEKSSNNLKTEFINENKYSAQYNRTEMASEVPKNYSKVTIPPKAYRNVYVSHVINPSDFYCQIEEDSSKLIALMQDIENIYSNVKDNELNLNQLKVNSPCCAVFQEDGAWYRASIKEVNSREGQVCFVDYGNTDTVPISKLKALKSNLMELPPQALKCKLYNASPEGGKWSEQAIEDFTNLSLDKSFVAQFVELDSTDTYAVNLVSLNKLQEEVLNKQFVNLGHGQLQDKTKILILNSHSASNNITYKSLEVRLGSSEAVTVYYGLNPQEIFCQLKSYEQEFRKLMENLQQYYNKLSQVEAAVDRPHSGMICVAQFYQDSVWYRGQITKVDKNSISVLYVDYGNTEIVEKKKIRCIAQDFTTLPVQCIKCRIKDIAPPGKSWPSGSNVSKYFDGDANCEFLSKEEDYYYINLRVNQKNVVEQLVKDGLAVLDQQEQIEEVPVQRQNELTAAHKSTPIPSFPKRESFVPGQLLPVTISYNESPSKFWCQSLDENDTLEQLMADIQSHVEKGLSLVNANELTAGYYCMAKYSEDESWYRAQIKSCLSADEYEVFYIDYGNTEVTSLTAISQLPVEFRKIHHLCFQCQLLGVPSVCPADKVQAFQTIVDESGHDMTAKVEKISGEAYVITLLYEVEEIETNVSEALFGSEVISLSPTTETKFLPPDVPLGLQEGYVTIVNSPHDFYIQLAGCEDDLAELAAELSDKCEAIVEGQEVIQNPAVGCACAAKYSEDNNWYRGEVIMDQGADVEILFVDYGNTSIVPKEDLKILGDKFLSVPPYAIKCKLNGIIPSAEQWSESAINTFQDLVLESLLGITFICKDIPAIVNVSKDDKDVGQNLIDLELANVDTCTETNEAFADDHLSAPIEDQLHSLPFDQSYPKRKLSSTKLPIKICYVDSCNKFYIMPLELSTELDTVMKTLEILYIQTAAESESVPESSALETLEEPRALLPCVAQCSEDEAWYRALITEVEGDNIYVTFVDYGNSEVSSLKNLKPLTPELLKIPPIAMECSLYAIQAVEGKEKELTDKLEEYFVDEVELEMELYKPEEPYKIRLYRNGRDIAETLCQDGIAKEVIPPPETVSTEVVSSNLTDDLKESLKIPVENSELSIEQRKITALDDQMSINVKHVEVKEEKIFLYGVSVDLEDELASFQEKLQAAYLEVQVPLPEVKESHFCVAKYLQDECWYRGHILNCSSEGILVQFIDYGNSEIVDNNDLKELLPEFADDPAFSIAFSPSGIVVEDADKLQGQLDEMLYNDPVQLSICKYSHTQHVMCFTSLLCGSKDLIEKLLNENLISQVFTPNTSIKGKFEAHIENSIGSIFYILPASLIEKRGELQDRLQSYFCDISPLEDAITPLRLYAANIDNKWNRVSIVSVSETSAVVLCIDFGVNATVDHSQLAILPKDFCHEPLLVQPSAIVDYEDASSDYRESLLERVQKREIFHIEVEARSNDSLLQVKLVDASSMQITNEQPECSADETTLLHQEQPNIFDTKDELIQQSPDITLTADSNLNDAKATDVEFNQEAEANLYSLNVCEDEQSTYPEKDEEQPDDKVGTDVEFDQEAEENMYSLNVCENEQPNYPVEEDIQSYNKLDIDVEFNQEAEKNLYSLNVCEDEQSTYPAKEDEQSNDEVGIDVEFNQDEKNIHSLNVCEDKQSNYPVEEDIQSNNKVDTNVEFNQEAEENLYSLNVCEDEQSTYPVKEDEQSNDKVGTDVEFDHEAEENMHSLSVCEDEQSNYPVEEDIQSNNKVDINVEFNQEAEENLYSLNVCEDEQSTYPVKEDDQSNGEVDVDVEFNQEAEENMYSLNICEDEQTNVANEHSDVEAELEISAVNIDDSEEDKDREEKCVEDNKKHEKTINDCEEMEKFVNDNKQQEKLLDDDAEYISASEDTKRSETDTDDSDKYKGIEIYQDKVVNKVLDVDNKQNEVPESMVCQELECTVPNESNALTNKLEDDFSCDESGSYKSAEVLDYENERFREFSDAESEIQVPCQNTERAEGEFEQLHAKGTTIHDSDNTIELDEFSQEPESSCLEYVTTEPSSSELKPSSETDTNSNISNSLKEPFHSSETKADVDQPVNSSPDHDDSFSETDKIILEENEWDERPECDIKLELADRLNRESIDSELRTESESATNSEIKDRTRDFADMSDDRLSLESTSIIKQLSDLAGQVCVFNQLKELSLDPLFKLTDSGVTISQIAVSDGKVLFPVIPKTLLPKLAQLKGTLQRVYSVEKPMPSNVSESSLYAVFCDGEWHRGKVLDCKEDSATVLIIDSGSCHTVELSAIRDLQEELKTLSPFAFWCVLASAYCPSHNIGVLKIFLDAMLADAINTKQDMSVKIIQDEEPYKVNLYIEGVELLHILLEKEQVIQQLTNPVVLPGDHLAKISYSNLINCNSVELYITLVSELDNLNNLVSSMQQVYPVDDLKLPIIESGAYAVQHNGIWRRGKALSSAGEKTLLLVDTGEIIKTVDVYPLLPEHCLLPPYSIPCEVINLDFEVEVDISQVISIFSEEKFSVNIETLPSNRLLAKISDEHFLQKLKKALSDVSTKQ